MGSEKVCAGVCLFVYVLNGCERNGTMEYMDQVSKRSKEQCRGKNASRFRISKQ